MKKELELQLVKKYPLLYGDYNGDPRHTCMCWGFPGDGWYNIIDEASAKLEAMISKHYSQYKHSVNCANCLCDKEDHYGYLYKPGKCLNVRKISTKEIKVYTTFWKGNRLLTTYRIRYIYKNVLRFLTKPINWILRLFYHKYHMCHCEQYRPNIPRMIQIKEKFGELVIYMSSYLDGFNEIIAEARKKSSVTCDTCGELGCLRNNHGWLSTLCDKCAIDIDGDPIPKYNEEGNMDDEY